MENRDESRMAGAAPIKLGGINAAYVQQAPPEACDSCAKPPIPGNRLHLVEHLSNGKVTSRRWLCRICCERLPEEVYQGSQETVGLLVIAHRSRQAKRQAFYASANLRLLDRQVLMARSDHDNELQAASQDLEAAIHQFTNNWGAKAATPLFRFFTKVTRWLDEEGHGSFEGNAVDHIPSDKVTTRTIR